MKHMYPQMLLGKSPTYLIIKYPKLVTLMQAFIKRRLNAAFSDIKTFEFRR